MPTHSPEAEQLRAALEACLRILVEDEDSVVVSPKEGDESLILRVRVAPDDYGRVAGKFGTTIDAINVVWRKAATRKGKWVRMEVDLEDTRKKGKR